MAHEDFPVVVFKGESQYDSLRHIADQLAQGFSDVVVIDLAGGEDNLKILHDLDGVKFAVGLNAVGASVTVDRVKDGKVVKENIWQMTGIPFISYMVDHPLWHIDRLAVLPERATVTVANRDHMVLAWKKATANNTVSFLPMGGSDLGRGDGDRPIDILFLGSAYKEPEVAPMVHTIADILANERTIDYVDAAEIAFKSHDCYLNGRDAKYVILRAQQVVRARERQETIRMLNELQREGTQVAFFGKGQPNGEVSYERGLELMRQAKIVVNHSPLLINGAHERVFNAALAGAAIMSTQSKYMYQIGLRYMPIFGGGSFNADWVRGWLDSPNQEILDSNYEIVKGGHTWAHRAQALERVESSFNDEI